MNFTGRIIGALLICLPASVWGFNMSFMKDAPITRFNDEDLRIFKQAVASALDSLADGESTEWRNPDTASSGTLTLLRTFDARGTTCRRMNIANAAGGLTATSAYDFCKAADGAWEIVVQ